MGTNQMETQILFCEIYDAIHGRINSQRTNGIDGILVKIVGVEVLENKTLILGIRFSRKVGIHYVRIGNVYR